MTVAKLRRLLAWAVTTMGTLPMVWLSLGAPAVAHAAEVSGIAAGGREWHIRLTPHESLQVGEVVRAGQQQTPMQVVEVVGRRARLWSDQPVQAMAQQRLELPVNGRLAAPPPVRQRWRTPPPRDILAPAQLAEHLAQWRLLTQTWQPWIQDPLRRGGLARQHIKGQVGLAAIAVAGDAPWTALRINNDLQWLGVLGSSMSWRHDVALWIEPWTTSAGPSADRMLQLRQAQLSLDPRFSRPWGADLGRVWVPEGGGSSTLDGAALRLRPLPHLEITTYAGSLPSLRTTAFQQSAWRAGAAAAWRGSLRGWQGEATADGSLGQIDRGWDRGQASLRVRGEHGRWGRADAELQLAIGQANLDGTAWAGQSRHPGGLRPVRGVLDYAPGALGRWSPRLRYQYTASELTRELAWSLPNQGWGTSQSHALAGWLHLPNWWGLRTATSGWASWTASEDPWEDWRFGGTLQIAKPGWPISAVETQLIAVAQTGPHLSGGSLAASAVWSPGLHWSWHARLRWNRDRVESSGSTAQGLDARMGVDWGRSPWSLGVSAGGRRTLWTDVEIERDWLDVTTHATYRL